MDNSPRWLVLEADSKGSSCLSSLNGRRSHAVAATWVANRQSHHPGLSFPDFVRFEDEHLALSEYGEASHSVTKSWELTVFAM